MNVFHNLQINPKTTTLISFHLKFTLKYILRGFSMKISGANWKLWKKTIYIWNLVAFAC